MLSAPAPPSTVSREPNVVKFVTPASFIKSAVIVSSPAPPVKTSVPVVAVRERLAGVVDVEVDVVVVSVASSDPQAANERAVRDKLPKWAAFAFFFSQTVLYFL